MFYMLYSPLHLQIKIREGHKSFISTKKKKKSDKGGPLKPRNANYNAATSTCKAHIYNTKQNTHTRTHTKTTT